MKKVIFILIGLLIITVSILLIVLLIQYNSETKMSSIIQEEYESYTYGINNPGLLIEGSLPKKTVINNIFFTVEDCVRTYIKYNTENNKQAVYSLIDYKYINEKNITLENISEYIDTHTNSDINKTLEMYELAGSNYYTYYVKHILGSNIIYFIVNTDVSTYSFSIIPINKTEYDKKILEPGKSFGTQEDKVTPNIYNHFEFLLLNLGDVIKKYYNDYRENVNYNIELAYNSLDEEYKKEKFSDIQKYKQYINTTKPADLDYYSIEKTEDFIEKYIYKDINGKKYTFIIKNIMNYSVTLD